MSDSLALSIEPPILLPAEAQKGLQEARRKASELLDGTPPQQGDGQADDQAQSDVLRRAWLDEKRTFGDVRMPLSVRLQKLWSERGDFSRYRASDHIDQKDEEQERNAEDELEVNMNGLVSEEGGDVDKEEEDSEAKAEGEAEAQRQGDVMSIEDMRSLRAQMLERLGVAQNSLYFSHALVSLLVNSTKGDSSLTGRAGAGSAASASGIQAQARAGAATSASGIFQRSLGGGGGAPSLGSASALEAELGIEPYIFGASQIDAQRRQLERRLKDEQEGRAGTGRKRGQDMDDDADDSDEHEDMEKDRIKVKEEDAHLLDEEVEDQARELVERYEGKVQGVRSAIDILRKGAASVHPDNKDAGREKVRWTALLEAKRAGWTLTPGKPARLTSAKKRELLQDYSFKRKDEAARDAWIGYGVPEAPLAYRRRALAYISHSSQDGDRPVDALTFTSTTRKRMCVEISVGKEVWTSEDESFAGSDKGEQSSLDGALREAQTALVDEELFDTLVSECRALSLSGSYQAAVESENCVSVGLNPSTKMRFIKKDLKSGEGAKADQSANAEDETHSEESNAQPSALVTCVLSTLRLALLCRYRERAGLQSESQPSSHKAAAGRAKGEEEAVKAPLLQPILGLMHYASFVAHLHLILQGLQDKFAPDMHFELNAFDSVVGGEEQRATGGERAWLTTFLQQPGKWGGSDAVKSLGGTATVYHSQITKPIAFLTLSYPSQISLTLLRKGASTLSAKEEEQAATSASAHLASVDLPSLRAVLTKELTVLQGRRDA